MKLNELKPGRGSRKAAKRVGRGDASGHGGTSTRGHKGQKSRSGGFHKRAFEGGQTPIIRRLPKRGFTNVFRTAVGVINLDQLANWPVGTPVTLATLKTQRILRRRYDVLKVLARGEITQPIIISGARVSEAARKKIEAAGGKVES